MAQIAIKLFYRLLISLFGRDKFSTGENYKHFPCVCIRHRTPVNDLNVVTGLDHIHLLQVKGAPPLQRQPQ
ncbi:hypothetical protein GCK32_003963 [Trichostrongylus colubriformis]|uniref:Uncharacterized protein n=1 Tax=Trichostrongylus colubriformis TaxID=6319 RepID=A0AAN8ETC8_TRICO